MGIRAVLASVIVVCAAFLLTLVFGWVDWLSLTQALTQGFSVGERAAQSGVAAPTVGLRLGGDRRVDAGRLGAAPYAYRRRIESGDTLSGVLTHAGLSAAEAQAAIEALRRQFDPRRLRPGAEITVALAPVAAGDASHRLRALRLRARSLERISVTPGADGTLQARKEKIRLNRRLVGATGSVESSLFEAGAKAGIPASVLAEMIRMYSWDVDFQRDVRRGDDFAVLYERFETEDGIAGKPGHVIVAALTLSGTRQVLYRYAPGKGGSADFFTPQGRSARKGLLRTPIDGARVSSPYGMRRHPILGYSRMHRGIDFAAPRGTPVFAAGDGTVDYVGRKGGYGRYVRLRHRSGYSTAYAHLSRYRKGLRRGKRVKQGQIIGYVGSSGRSTGPHLHYEIIKAGRKINPQKVKTLPGRKLAGVELKRFLAFVAASDQQLAAALDAAAQTRVASAEADAAR